MGRLADLERIAQVRLAERSAQTARVAAELATESGLPAFGLNGSPLVRCPSCQAIGYCAPSDHDRTGCYCPDCSRAQAFTDEPKGR